MEDTILEKVNKLTISNIIRYLIIFMVISVSFIVMISMVRGVYDLTGITMGLIFIFVLMFIKWLLGEMNIE